MAVKLSSVKALSTAGATTPEGQGEWLTQATFPSLNARQFIQKWKLAANLKERSASQSHFNDICVLIGEPTPTDADSEGTWYTFEKGASKIGAGKGWADVWRKGCFAWEYKGKHKDLGAALAQLQRYAIALDNPPLLVVSDMETIIIHTNFNNSIHQEHRITLDDLANPDAFQKLKNLFKAPQEFDPRITTVSVTTQAAEAFASIAQYLRDQGHASRRVAHFMTKLIFCMFAEDIKILPGKVFTHLVESVEKQPEKFADRLKKLFGAMKSGGDYGYVDIPWFNGGLFDDDDTLPLDQDGVRLILQAAQLDWSQIEPSIFGTLFERGLDPSKRSQIGAHYTDLESIRRIINPVLKEPLEAEWNDAKRAIGLLIAASAKAAKPSTRKKTLKEAEAIYEGFLERLCSFRVLDAGCGSGNFLYLALIELKNLEHRVRLEGETFGFHRSFYKIGPQNVTGIEINDYAAELARITIWIGEIQWMIQNGFGVPRNPVLRRLEQIENRDALVNADGTEANWPAVDCIIGNPPFLGDKKMLAGLGPQYVSRLRRLYSGRVPGGADLVTYWFEKARAAIEAGRAQRAGLVATNSIRQKRNRAVLDRIRETGEIYRAWSDRPWINEGAAVRVSMVCFSSRNHGLPVQVDDESVEAVYSDLSGGKASGADITKARPLAENKNCSFFGLCLAGHFAVSGEIARQWLVLPNPHGRPNSDVLRPIYNGADILKGRKDRWVIDFGPKMSVEEAALYETPFAYVQEHVRPVRAENNRKARAERWWQHGEARPGMRDALKGHDRYIATVETAKHRIFVWLSSSEAPEHNLIVIPRSDDVTFGILSSRFHAAWALAAGGRLGVGNDPRYNSTRCFETFPFPTGLTPDVPASRYFLNPRARKIAEASKRLVELRDAWLTPSEWVNQIPEVVPSFPNRNVPVSHQAADHLKKRTLTNLYNSAPQWLVQAHRKIDEAVASAYGWDPEISEEAVLASLLKLNQKRSVAAVARPRKAVEQKTGSKKPHQQSFIYSYNGKRKSKDPHSTDAQSASGPPESPAQGRSRKVACVDAMAASDQGSA